MRNSIPNMPPRNWQNNVRCGRMAYALLRLAFWLIPKDHTRNWCNFVMRMAQARREKDALAKRPDLQFDDAVLERDIA